MGCGCNKHSMCDSLKSVPAKIVFDKTYTPLSESTEKFRKYQNYINQDLQNGIKDNKQNITDLNSQTELLRKEDELLHAETDTLEKDLQAEVQSREQGDKTLQENLDTVEKDLLETMDGVEERLRTVLKQQKTIAENLQEQIDSLQHEEITAQQIDEIFYPDKYGDGSDAA